MTKAGLILALRRAGATRGPDGWYRDGVYLGPDARASVLALDTPYMRHVERRQLEAR